MLKSGSLNLVPADSSEVSRCDTDEFSSALHVLEELRNSGTDHRANFFVIRFNFPAHNGESLGEQSFESVVLDAFAIKRGAQNRKVGHAVIRHALDVGVDAIRFEH